MKYNATRALELLRLGSNQTAATFREGQEDAIKHIVEGRGRLLVVQKTGWGKSFVYFIATKLLRENGDGPALLISPLLALMRNQVSAAQRMGVRAVTINSGNRDEWENIEAAISRGEVDILLISPERFANAHFNQKVLAVMTSGISLIVVDEAHCISDWGHDFRPHYRLLERMVRSLPANIRLLATTATANNRVMEDLRIVLGPKLEILRGDLGRPSLTLQTIRLRSQPERLAWLAEHVPLLGGSGIIYTLTVRDAEQVAEWLKSLGLNVEAYTGESGETRPLLEQALLDNRVKALVATTALGMGYDKPDLAFVIHYQSPGSVVAYYQQVGRAGRALSSAYGVLLSGEEETEIADWFINTAFPSVKEVEQILGALDKAEAGLSLNDLMKHVNGTRGRIKKALDLLALESPAPVVEREGKWELTTSPLSQAFWERASRLTDLRRTEQQEMRDYVELKSGHMEFLIRALDGEVGDTPHPLLPSLPNVANSSLVVEATNFLRRTSIPIQPRKKGPTGKNIEKELQCREGRALCHWRDAGWGELVYQGKYERNHFGDNLLGACAALVREWSPQPEPTWMTCVPSLRHPDLVPDFARRLAAELKIPFHVALRKTENRPEQKTMANSVQQARNINGSLEVCATNLPGGPVLLFDDIVDSRWTFTFATWLLRKKGRGEVWPLALAMATHGKD